jgi:hypothetical protein
MTKERPILFSAPMVRAILSGTKTQTRRIVKPQPTKNPKFAGGAYITQPKRTFSARQTAGDIAVAADYVHLCCPYGQPGDRLWVRESFWGCDSEGMGDTPCVVYDDEWNGKEYRAAEIRPWAPKFGRIPSIHMPRNCSRILLEVTGVRVERLNDCSVRDAIDEGAAPLLPAPAISQACPEDYLAGFRQLWDSINGAGAWSANPWVWVVEFRRTA